MRDFLLKYFCSTIFKTIVRNICKQKYCLLINNATSKKIEMKKLLCAWMFEADVWFNYIDLNQRLFVHRVLLFNVNQTSALDYKKNTVTANVNNAIGTKMLWYSNAWLFRRWLKIFFLHFGCLQSNGSSPALFRMWPTRKCFWQTFLAYFGSLQSNGFSTVLFCEKRFPHFSSLQTIRFAPV